MSALVRGAVSVLAIAMVAGCSSDGGSLPPIRVPSSTVGSGPRPTVAPPVTRTLDLAAYHTRPCELLKPDQRGPFDRQPLASKDFLERCSYDASLSDSSVTVILGLNGEYLSEVYQASNKQHYEIFEPFTIGEQPAVMFNSSPRRTTCEVVVGTAPKDFLHVSAKGQAMSEDACITAATIAQRVIGNLGG